jgi:PTH1 family peptidyl-tRNA hydrolase
MNLSGQGVVPLMRKFKVKPEDLLVIHDDLDLSFGGIRLRPGGSAGGHRGVQSIIDQLQTRNFPRLRVGIDRPPEGEDAAEYVLHPFPWDNRETLDEMLELAVAAVRVWVAEGIETAMNRSNKRRSQKSDPQDCGIPDR